MAFLPPEDAAAVGRSLKRILGRNPVRFRYACEETRFLLTDCTDADAGALVRSGDCLQLAGCETTPLVVDIDSLHPGGNEAASDAVFSTERLQCATRLLTAVLRSRFHVELVWFSSGKQGVHGWAFGIHLTASTRQTIAALLPQGVDTHALQSPAYAHESVQLEAEAGLGRLGALDWEGCGDDEWIARLRAAFAPEATLQTKLIALTAFYDVGVTTAGRLRLPCSYNAKDDGYAGFPLPNDDGSRWLPLRRAASVPLSVEELALLSRIVIPTADECSATLAALKADTHTRKRVRDGVASDAYVPRLHPRRVALPVDPVTRASLIPECVRGRLSTDVVRILERGMERGGMPIWKWIGEPDDERRRDSSARGGGLGGADAAKRRLPLALDALLGLDITAKGRGDVARGLIASAFPVDVFAAAMVASGRLRELAHWASWFDTYAAGKGKAGTLAWRYDAGRLCRIGNLCPMVRSQCAAAATVLNPKGGGGGDAPKCKRSRPVAASRPLTGRIVDVVLPGTSASLLEAAKPLIRARAEKEFPDAVGAKVKDWIQYTEKNLEKLFESADPQDDGTVVLKFTEYLATEGRLSYECKRSKGLKSIKRELRNVIFAGAWSVDLCRCHTNSILGAYQWASKVGVVDRHALLDRLCSDLPGVEADIVADQVRLLPEAKARLGRLQQGTKEAGYAAKFIGYLQIAPKTLLSAMLNQPNDSMMFRRWPLAAACCRALGVAAAAAKQHPLVVADRFRPDLIGTPAGGKKEKQQLAFIFERRALQSMIAALESSGFAPSITVNDELLFFPPTGTDICTVKTILESAVANTLQFDAPIRVEPVSG